MKNNIILILTIIFSITVITGKSQIQVDSDGQVKVFGNIETDDPNNDLSMQIYGKYGQYLANGKLGFGDYGRVAYNGSNVFIGELGTNWDSDRLELHGKNGIYLTYGKGYDYGKIIGKWDVSEPDRFKFEVDVYAKGVLLSSDSRFKENIKPLEKGLNKLKQLNGISYTLKNNQLPVAVPAKGELTEKEQKDLEKLSNRKTKEHIRMGFIAQEVRKLFPELVQEDTKGYLYVDYVGLIPVLVESVKEQQAQIDELLKLAAKKGLIVPKK